ncbi:MAG: GLPGLI family protein [Bacteroidota bacterium]
MKKYLLASFIGGLCAATFSVQAQQKQGVVHYDRTSQIQISFQGMPGGMEQQMPKSRTDKFDLTFGNNQSLWKQAEPDGKEENSFGGDGMHMQMIVAGSNDVLYSNFETGKRTEKREMFEKTFIIDDTLGKLKWKMTGETKTILGMPCMKATTTTMRTRTTMNMDNGKMERKEIQDTSNIIAWFTSSIPVSAGPAEYQGQLPGLILEMDIKNGTQVFKATGISEKADLAVIKEPTGKKHYTADEFKKERDKMLEEMSRNNQGGGQRMIRIN